MPLREQVEELCDELRKFKARLAGAMDADIAVVEARFKRRASELVEDWVAIRRQLRKLPDEPHVANAISRDFRALKELSEGSRLRSKYDQLVNSLRRQLNSLLDVMQPISGSGAESRPDVLPAIGAESSSRFVRRIYISMPADRALNDRENGIKWGIVRLVEEMGHEPQVFTGPTGGLGLPAGKAWTFSNVDEVMRRCWGAVIIGLPKWTVKQGARQILLPSDYCQYEGAVAQTYGLPMFVAADEMIEPRGLFNAHGFELVFIPQDVDKNWLNEPAFRRPFSNWKTQLSRRHDVFLGYCSSSRGTARNIKTFLLGLGLSVLDWVDDFGPGVTILENIQDAASRCSAGIFLFTKDDVLEGGAGRAAPRDNVVFEAGLFIHAKEKKRVLIILEQGAKMPADLGGDIYLPLLDKSNIEPLEGQLLRFLNERI